MNEKPHPVLIAVKDDVSKTYERFVIENDTLDIVNARLNAAKDFAGCGGFVYLLTHRWHRTEWLPQARRLYFK